ncbi:hypothetical protein T11_16367 [Trichinella zimbabwensis]|uniref:Uncharacterized protein n=1 Tax=Trichinella zimbabwensis TaxID=268475 RepID=A0A0V1GNA6_9BILA|nr:hypothetical protein T11_16367 [Trichinella zimbabwensis]
MFLAHEICSPVKIPFHYEKVFTVNVESLCDFSANYSKEVSTNTRQQ